MSLPLFFAGATCASLVFTLLNIIVYFTKNKINSVENSIYKFLIISNFIALLLELCCHYFVVNLETESGFFADLIFKLYVVFLLVWIVAFNIYVFFVTPKKTSKNDFDKESHFNKLVNYTAIPFSIIAIAILILPIEKYYDGMRGYTYGPALDYIFTPIGFIFFILWIVLCIKDYKNLKEKKYIPIIVMTVLLLVVAIVQTIDRGILIVGISQTLVTVLMFHTIENPDLKLINELNIAKDQAEKANNSKTEFLSNMSHEIRTPLNAIVGFSQALLEEEIPEESKLEVKDIIMASEILLEIVNGILDISKIEANKLEIINSEYNTEKMLRELVSLTRARMGDKPLDFRTSFDPDIPPFLYGDISRLKQVIINLLTNSVKYTNEGYVDFKVSAVRKDNVCRLIFAVEDSGLGIKPENIKKLFKKFERFNEGGNTSVEGTGLGLAITKKLIELMGGQIVVQSVYGQGSKFTVAINQRIVDRKEPLEQPIENTQVYKTLDLSNKRVLVVDDNKLNLKVATRLLTAYKMKVETIDNGFDFIEKIKSGSKYDLILLDDMMPKMSGTQSLKKLKAEVTDFNIPTVALTANAIEGMREQYLRDGFDDYLAKPIEKPELNRVIMKYLVVNNR